MHFRKWYKKIKKKKKRQTDKIYNKEKVIKPGNKVTKEWWRTENPHQHGTKSLKEAYCIYIIILVFSVIINEFVLDIAGGRYAVENKRL